MLQWTLLKLCICLEHIPKPASVRSASPLRSRLMQPRVCIVLSTTPGRFLTRGRSAAQIWDMNFLHFGFFSSLVVQVGIGRVRANLASQVKKGRMSQQALDTAMSRLKGTVTYDNFQPVDMVRASLTVPGLRGPKRARLLRCVDCET